jgi:HAD superfamily hydrolase (TIGR01509 family)
VIRALIFDLDGTLINTEPLKAQAYVAAIRRVRTAPLPDELIMDACWAVVGTAGEEAAQTMVERLGLAADLEPLTGTYGVTRPWEVLDRVWSDVYGEMVADPQLLRDQMWPDTPGLLELAREMGCRTGLATMSYRHETEHVLSALGIKGALEVVVTCDDVERPKPDPQVYHRVSGKLGVAPGECLVLEDTPRGVQAAVSAGMSVIAVATPFTEQALRESPEVDPAWIVDDRDTLLAVVRRRVQEGGAPS